MAAPFDADREASLAQALIDRYAARLERLYGQAVSRLVQVALNAIVGPDLFSFAQDPRLGQQATAILTQFARDWLKLVTLGTGAGWAQSDRKNDRLVGYLNQITPLSRATLSRYNARNLEALAAYQSRVQRGLNLSDRIWHYTGQFRSELELALDRSIGEGVSAATLSRRVRSLLAQPDNLFRRVRNERGVLALSTRMASFKPGTGVYRSSYKNAMRLTVTEINNAYRAADHERWNRLDVVVGIEVRRSNRPGDCPICPRLVGKYPKTYRFTGSHPSCRCYAVPILVTPDELMRLNETDVELPAGEVTSVNRVSRLPGGFTRWIKENRPRWTERGGQKPQFVEDNEDLLEEEVENG